MDTGQHSLDQCVQSPMFWYSEGNVVLRVDDSLFRIHRGVLETHSQIFKDTFSIPQPTTEALISGCQVVPLQDSVKDWETVLTLMYYPLSLHPGLPDVTVDQLGSLMRIAKKYQCDALLRSCVSRIKADLPSTLQEYDKAHPLSGHIKNKTIGGTPLTSNAHSLIALINLALEYGINTALPCGYYLLMTRLAEKEIVTGASIDGDSDQNQQIVLDSAAHIAILQGLVSIQRHTLEAYVRWLNIHGINGWTRWCAEDYYEYENYISLNPDSDVEYPDCPKKFANIGANILNAMMDPNQSKVYALASWRSDNLFNKIVDGMCETCAEQELGKHDIARQFIWDTLPIVFGFHASWGGLKDDV